MDKQTEELIHNLIKAAYELGEIQEYKARPDEHEERVEKARIALVEHIKEQQDQWEYEIALMLKLSGILVTMVDSPYLGDTAARDGLRYNLSEFHKHLLGVYRQIGTEEQ